MNFHNDDWVFSKLRDHAEEAATLFTPNQMVGLFLQGSQNYGMDVEGSDVDTKLVVLPSFKDVVMNRSPVSTTHLRANEEHIDLKDLRLYFQTFRKQNVNFVEVLFTKYKLVNPKYAEVWQELVDNREAVAHFNPCRAVAAMKGTASDKYFAMEHHYPSKEAVLAKYGYDPKQLHHLLRMEEFMKRYVAGEPYEACLLPAQADFFREVKLGCLPLEKARELAKTTYDEVCRFADEYRNTHTEKVDVEVAKLLDDTMYEVMKLGMAEEFK